MCLIAHLQIDRASPRRIRQRSGERCRIALLIFGLIETELRKTIDDHELLPGLLPENRAAKPTGRNVLGVFQGLGLTYTQAGIRLDRLTHTQRRILELLQINPPWPEQTTQHPALT